MLTRHDLSDPLNAREAQHRLRRCTTESDYAAWAAEWGEPLTAHALNSAGPCAADPMPIEERLL